MFYSVERDRKFDFTSPHSVNNYVAVTRRGELDAPVSLGDLKGKSIVVQKGDIIHDYLMQRGLESRISTVETQEEMLRGLSEGKYDCALGPRIIALHIIKALGLTNLALSQNSFFALDYCYAVPNGHAALLAQFSEGLRVLKDSGEYRRLHQKWMGVYEQPSLTFVSILRKIAMILVPLLLLLLGFFLWSWTLRRQVKTRTRELRESESRFRKLFEQVPAIAVQGYGMDGIARYWNEASENLYGYSADEAIGAKLTDLIIPPEARKDVEAAMRSMAVTKVPTPASELTLMRKDGSRVLVFSSHAIVEKAGGEAELFCVDIDLTSRKEAEEALRKLKNAAETANQAKSEFLANMSHEIRTPINGVMGMLQLMETTPLDAEQLTYVQMATGAANRLTRLLSDILDLSRVEAGKMEIRKAPFLIQDIIDSVSGLFAVTARNKGVALDCNLAPGMPAALVGDEMRVRQVLFNLVGNALKFTERGRVVVDIEALPAKDDGTYSVRFCVRDTGIGIAQDRLGDIFEPFRQVENSFTRNYQGAGLGLSIVQRLVGLMEGEISIESAPGEGTSVHVVLPFKMDRENSSKTVEPAAIKTGAGFRVLLVEDDPSNRIPTQKLLEKAGHEVTLAENGRQTFELLVDNDFDCILMDIQMPVMDGIEATRIIRESATLGPKKDIPIIALTAYAMEGDKEKFLAAGMNGHVAKPVNIDSLLQGMTEAMARQGA